MEHLLENAAELRRAVDEIVDAAPVFDIHTHLFAPGFGELGLSGIDELVTYHYLVAETLRATPVTAEQFWSLGKTEQADLVWHTLFVDRTPISEAARGVVTVLDAFALDVSAPDLTAARDYFGSVDPGAHLARVLELAGVTDVVMTNDPLDAAEAHCWEAGGTGDPRFHAALRMDPLLNDWANAVAKLSADGYGVDLGLGEHAVTEARRFLDSWIARMKPLYMAVSLPDDFVYPGGGIRDRLLDDVVLPTAREHGLSVALMIGVRRGVNPALRVAGDGVGRADVGSLERLCVVNPDVRFLSTFLSRENQHELCVASRKFANLMPFGCWWFLNNPSIVSEITRERLELLGTTFIPQHSDARVLEQLVYKWRHSRRVIADALVESYGRLLTSGRPVTSAEIARDVTRLFSGNFKEWVGLVD